jgi:hypothetical protein
VKTIKKLADYLFNNFVLEGSDYPKIFNSISTPDINSDFLEFITELKSDYRDIIINSTPPKRISIDFPRLYLHQIVFKEIKRNLRYADSSREIDFVWSDKNDSLLLKISNFISKNIVLKGGGKGLNRLNKLNDFPIKSTYKCTSQKTTFIQHISFTKL